MEEILHPAAGDCRHRKKLPVIYCTVLFKFLESHPIPRDIELCPHYDLGLFEQFFIIQPDLPVYFFEIPYGIIRGKFRYINEVEEYDGPLGMPEKLEAKSRALMGAFNKTGDISNNKAPELRTLLPLQEPGQGS